MLFSIACRAGLVVPVLLVFSLIVGSAFAAAGTDVSGHITPLARNVQDTLDTLARALR